LLRVNRIIEEFGNVTTIDTTHWFFELRSLHHRSTVTYPYRISSNRSRGSGSDCFNASWGLLLQEMRVFVINAKKLISLNIVLEAKLYVWNRKNHFELSRPTFSTL